MTEDNRLDTIEKLAYIINEKGELGDIVFTGKVYTEHGYIKNDYSLANNLPNALSISSLKDILNKINN